MPSFGLITEGVTDQAVIENIIWGVFGEEAEVNELQPIGDETYQRKAEDFGGWYNVLLYCGSPEFSGALQFNDFLIVQIDTDCCHKAHYDVSRKDEGGNDRTPDEMIAAVKTKIISRIGEGVWNRVSERVIFAIAVDSIECWVLVLHAPQERKAKYNNCLFSLQQELARRDIRVDPNDKKPAEYETISVEFSKRKVLADTIGYNASLDAFVAKLQSLKTKTKEERVVTWVKDSQVP